LEKNIFFLDYVLCKLYRLKEYLSFFLYIANNSLKILNNKHEKQVLHFQITKLKVINKVCFHN